MAVVVSISDGDDPRLADYVALTDASARRTTEAGLGCFIAEGGLAVRALLGSRYGVRSVLLAPQRLDQVRGELEGVDAPVYVASEDVLSRVAGYRVHRGILASGQRLPLPDLEAIVSEARTVVAVEDVNDHENLGSLFRNAAAFAAGAVVLSPGCADPLYRRSIRVSVGHVLRMPWTRVDPWPDRLAYLRAAGFEIVALTPRPDAVPVTALPTGRRYALLVGAEFAGLSEHAMTIADVRARIPMAAGVDSLNVATAAAVALSHLVDVR